MIVNVSANEMNCRLPKTKGFVSNDEIWSAVNLLGVIPQYEILGFCRLGLKGRNLAELKLEISRQKAKYHRACDILS